MAFHEIITHHDGQWRSWADLTGLMSDERREALHGEMVPCTAQEFWDAYCARWPYSADDIVDSTSYVDSVWDVLDISCDGYGDVWWVDDGQTRWYCESADFDAAREWAMWYCNDGEGGDAYEAFCERCPGHDQESEEALPLMARYAHAAYDLTTEAGRREALAEVFCGDKDRLAFACMLIDQMAEAS